MKFTDEQIDFLENELSLALISKIKELVKDDPNGSEDIKTLLYDEGSKMELTTEQLYSLLIKMDLPEKKQN